MVFGAAVVVGGGNIVSVSDLVRFRRCVDAGTFATNVRVIVVLRPRRVTLRSIGSPVVVTFVALAIEEAAEVELVVLFADDALLDVGIVVVDCASAKQLR